MKYLVHWKGYDDAADTWEEQNGFGNTIELLVKYWKDWELRQMNDHTSETVIKDLQGELECSHFHDEPERLYCKR